MVGVCSQGTNSFLYESTPYEMEGNNETKRVASPESVPIHPKMRTTGSQTVLRG